MSAERPSPASAGTQWSPTPPSPPPPPPLWHRGWFRGAVAIAVVVVVALAMLAYRKRDVRPEEAPVAAPSATGNAATLPPGRTWLSGAWTGGGVGADRIAAFGSWRGQPADTVTTYPAYGTWDELRGSDWHVAVLDGFPGRIVYGLPLLPQRDTGSLQDVAAGKYDDVWAAVAAVLIKHHRENSFLRIGLEANGTWFPWGATAATADTYKAAWRHVQSVLKSRVPQLTFVFDITCGRPLQDGADRLDSLNRLYPGDDVVDVVGCDHYDSYSVKSRNADEWTNTLHPEGAAGLGDVADFAREHHKQLAVGEWGLTSTDKSGAGDDPYFIYSMYGYFTQNKDILAFENYFNEPDATLGSAIWGSDQNPKSAAEYRKLWGAAASLPGSSPGASPAGGPSSTG